MALDWAFFFYVWYKAPPASALIAARPPEWWEKWALRAPIWLRLVFSKWDVMQSGAQCECVWSCKPNINSAAYEQVGGENDLYGLQKGHRTPSSWKCIKKKKHTDGENFESVAEFVFGVCAFISREPSHIWIKLCDMKNSSGMLMISLPTRIP